MPTVLDAPETPLTFEVGGTSFTIRDFENEVTTAENRFLMKAIAPLTKFFDAAALKNAKDNIVFEMFSEVDMALVLAICTRPSKSAFDKNRVEEWREFFDNNPLPEAAGEVFQRFLSIAPASIAKYSPIFSALTAGAKTEQKNSTKKTKN